MTPEHVDRYRLYDKTGTTLAAGQAALEQWRPGLTVRWLVPNEEPARRISEQARHRLRRQRLRKRLERQAPLFADELERETLAAQPEYYYGPAETETAAQTRRGKPE